MPEKYHGLHDVETRYRQRYVDLIVNDKSREILRKRSMILSKLNIDGMILTFQLLYIMIHGMVKREFVIKKSNI